MIVPTKLLRIDRFTHPFCDLFELPECPNTTRCTFLSLNVLRPLLSSETRYDSEGCLPVSGVVSLTNSFVTRTGSLWGGGASVSWFPLPLFWCFVATRSVPPRSFTPFSECRLTEDHLSDVSPVRRPPFYVPSIGMTVTTTGPNSTEGPPIPKEDTNVREGGSHRRVPEVLPVIVDCKYIVCPTGSVKDFCEGR